jgi:hypothetical protein
MRALRRRLRIQRKTRGNSEDALKEGKDLGVNLQFDNPWHTNKADEWVFGPDPIEDNVYRCLPQVNLHGMDEGLTEKLNYGVLLYAIAEVGTKKKKRSFIVSLHFILFQPTFHMHIQIAHVQLICLKQQFQHTFPVYIYFLHFPTWEMYVQNVHG